MAQLQQSKTTPALQKYYYIDNFEKLLKKITASHQASLSTADENFIQQYFQLDLNSKILLVRIANSTRFYFPQKEMLKYAKDCDVAKATECLMDLNFLKLVSTCNELAEPFEQSIKQELPQRSISYFEHLTHDLCEALVHGGATRQFEFDLESSSYFVPTFKVVTSYLEFLHFGNTTSNSTQFALAQMNLASDVSHGHVSGLSRVDWLFTKSVEVMTAAPKLQQTLFDVCHTQADLLAQELASVTSAALIKTLWFLKPPRKQKTKLTVGEKTNQAVGRLLGQASGPSSGQLPGQSSAQATTHNRSNLVNLVFSSKLSDFYAPVFRHLKRCKDTRLSEFIKKLPSMDLPPEIQQFLQTEVSRPRGEPDALANVPRRTVNLPHGSLADLENDLAQSMNANGIETYYTENRVWKMLFALTFWDVYFSKDAEGKLAFNTPTREFFKNNQLSLEQILARLSSPLIHQRHVLKNFAANYKKPQKFFRWTQKYMDPMLKLIQFSPPGAVAMVLTRMAKDFRFYCSGFPDLITVTDNKITFVEIKAEGDKISPKQNLRLFELKALGYDCEVVDVCWDQDDEQTYVVLDVETTGGLRGKNRVTEIGAVKIKNGKVIDNYQTLLNPCIPIPSFIVRLTGITNEMVASAPTFVEIAQQLREFLDGSIFVAHHVRFDYGFIQKEFQSIGEEFYAPTACTVALARRKFKGFESYSLKNLCQQLDIELETHHRAHCDAVAASQIFIKCMR